MEGVAVVVAGTCSGHPRSMAMVMVIIVWDDPSLTSRCMKSRDRKTTSINPNSHPNHVPIYNLPKKEGWTEETRDLRLLSSHDNNRKDS